MKRIKVLLADDHTVVRQGLRLLLESQRDLSVVGEAENGRQAVELTGKLKPDVVVMDITMPVLDGLEATRQIMKQAPTTKVLMLSMHVNDNYVRQFAEAGAAGYLPKEAADTDLIKAIREVQRGNASLSPAVSMRLLDHYREAIRKGVHIPQPLPVLTERETVVLQLIAEGEGSQKIAAKLGISVRTVQIHRQFLMDKLQIHTVAGLIRCAISKGLVKNPSSRNARTEAAVSQQPGHGKYVFVSYSRRNEIQVKQLCNRLKRDGYRIWLDKEEILGGQSWEDELYDAMRSASGALVCLSSEWTEDQGFAQEELRELLRIMRRQPKGAVFLIPVKLDRCDIPSNLRQLQWVEMNDAQGYNSLRRSLDLLLGDRNESSRHAREESMRDVWSAVQL